MSTLFEQIGGQNAVDAAVDIFYRKVLSDPSISHFFDDVDMDKQIAKQRVFLSFALGGIVQYSGKDMREAHKHLDITEDHFNSVAQHLNETLLELNVSDDLITQVMTVVASTHDDVLNI